MSSEKVTKASASPRPVVPMKVIVCSLPRSGTSSMKLALHQLGIYDVYHMSYYVDHTEDYEKWVDVVDDKVNGRTTSREKWDELLGNCQGIVDAPSCYFAVELAKAYPEAKIVILKREFEKWYTSVDSTVQEVIRLRAAKKGREALFRPWVPSQASNIIRLGNLISETGVGIGNYGKAETKKFYDDYYEACAKLAEIDPSRVLNFSVKDGWGPLAQHLGIRPPGYETENGYVEAPFPHVNDSEAFDKWIEGVMISNRHQMWYNMASQFFAVIGLGSMAAYFSGALHMASC